MDFLNLIFPKNCLGCGAEGGYICSECRAKVRLAKPICPHCQKTSIDGLTHIDCAPKSGLDGLIAVWEYEGVIRKAILSHKYKYSTEVGKELGDSLIQQLIARTDIPETQALIPIPMHWYKENSRGFNQSIEIGKMIATNLKLRFILDFLIKKKPTTSQTELKGEGRRQNLRGVFSLSPSYSSFTIPNSVILFDDVFTTGSTLIEAAKVLKRAGVSKVWGLTIAR